MRRFMISIYVSILHLPVRTLFFGDIYDDPV